MENVCQKCGEKVNDANIAACQGTPDGGCVWKSEALAAASVPVENIKPELLSADDAWLDAHYKAMVDRFLGWKLPQDFAPDCGISFTPPSELPDLYWPTGTNLLRERLAQAYLAEEMRNALPPDLPPRNTRGAT